ncbi:hypothetical protein EGY05_18615 [Chryseobacterium arthrosphaerae]|nr:hypothetical protein EGY05_18615 [Chryseobacterium arthrosphaerae]
MHGNLLLIFDELGKIYIIEKFYGCCIQEKDFKNKKNIYLPQIVQITQMFMNNAMTANAQFFCVHKLMHS